MSFKSLRSTQIDRFNLNPPNFVGGVKKLKLFFVPHCALNKNVLLSDGLYFLVVLDKDLELVQIKQGRIHGHQSWMRVGRGNDKEGQLSIWSGTVMQKLTINVKEAKHNQGTDCLILNSSKSRLAMVLLPHFQVSEYSLAGLVELPSKQFR